MRECLACSSFALCNFIFVMRENQVLTAAVQIERIAQIVRRHRRAFNMPARATLTPWRFPVWFTRLCSFPNSKVQRIFFLVIDINSSTCLQFFHRLTGKLAIVGKRSGAEVNIAVGFICMTAFHELLHHVNNQIHVFCYFRMDVCIHNIQAVCIGLVFPNIPFGKFRGWHALFVCPTNDFVINIGEILYISHFIATIFQIPPQHVKRTDWAGISDMNIVVNSWAAGINADVIRFNRN